MRFEIKALKDLIEIGLNSGFGSMNALGLGVERWSINLLKV